MSQRDGFYAAPFAIDGESMGIAQWRVADLSPKWIDVSEQMLNDLGPNFRTSLGQTLSHIEVQLTSTSGAGLGTFYANGEVVASTAYFRGDDPNTEREVMQLFIDSLRRIRAVQESQRTPTPFEGLTGVKERPLHAVPWVDPSISDQDADLVSEFANHFAAACLCRYTG